jgi:hypothetical protein
VIEAALRSGALNIARHRLLWTTHTPSRPRPLPGSAETRPAIEHPVVHLQFHHRMSPENVAEILRHDLPSTGARLARPGMP